MQVQFELTDLFGGQANYSWVKRGTIDVPENATDRYIMRQVKQKLGITGIRCRVSRIGDTWEFRPSGSLCIGFVSFSF